MVKISTIPHFIKPYFWSYNTDELDIVAHKDRIITNILNFGNKEAVTWLFSVYSKVEIKAVIEHPRSGEWNKKSISFWTLMFNVPNNYSFTRRSI